MMTVWSLWAALLLLLVFRPGHAQTLDLSHLPSISSHPLQTKTIFTKPDRKGAREVLIELEHDISLRDKLRIRPYSSRVEEMLTGRHVPYTHVLTQCTYRIPKKKKIGHGNLTGKCRLCTYSRTSHGKNWIIRGTVVTSQPYTARVTGRHFGRYTGYHIVPPWKNLHVLVREVIVQIKEMYSFQIILAGNWLCLCIE